MWLRTRTNNKRLFVGLLLGMIVLAWLALWLWGRSPYARFLSHDHLDVVATDGPAVLILFVAGRTLMTFAMMLPTSIPIITLFRSLTRKRSDGRLLVGLLILGYLGTWSVVGLFIHLGDLVIHRAVDDIAWLGANTWIIGTLTLAVAGIYQFTPLKHRCLEKCRSPLSFIIEHWQGRHENAQALRLGIRHGLFCVGCCWSLMLLMFSVGVGNLAWMLGLGIVMAIEKNTPWGRRLSAPLGIYLLIASLAVGLRALI